MIHLWLTRPATSLSKRCGTSIITRHYGPSTSANPFPYPSHTNPTPHQIFHLPRSAAKQDIKARYYELVRIYHPDSPVSRLLPAATAQARFQAITAAYDALRGKSQYSSEHPEVEKVKHSLHNLNTAQWKARQQKRAELRLGLDDRWKDSIMLGVVVLTLAAFVSQTYFTRREALHAQQERSTQRRSAAGNSSLPGKHASLSASADNHK